LRLLRLAVIAAAVAVLGIVACLVGAQQALVPELDGVNAATLALLAVVAGLLAANWLQDAHFLAEGEARFSFYRNLSFHGGRLVTPALVLGLALPYPIPMAWGAALLVSVLLAVALLPRVPDARPLEQPRHNEGVPRRAFLRTAGRNVAGSSAEFLPGLLLPPLVLHLQGDLAGAYFGIAWTGASTLFLLCAAISRSTLREMGGPGDAGLWIRRAARQHLLIVAPATIGAILFAPVLLGAFGPDYASHGWPVFVPLAASVALIAPVYLYLALLRSREARGALIAYPAILLVALFGLAVPLDQAYGMMGVAWAWIAAHIPVACVAAWQLRAELRKPAATRDTPVPPHASSTAYSRVAATLTMSPTAPRR
jgi:O-antigen/teichoic acid export membrane protein